MNFPPLNILDALIVITLGWNFIRGFSKGFMEEIISLGGIAVSILLSFNLSAPIANMLIGNGKADTTTIVVTGFIVYLISFIFFKYIAFNLNKQLQKTSFGIINSFLGFLFGIFRGIVIASIFVLGITFVAPNSYLVKKSYLGGLTIPVIDRALPFVPEKNRKKIEDNWKIAKKYLLKNIKKWKEEIISEKKV